LVPIFALPPKERDFKAEAGKAKCDTSRLEQRAKDARDRRVKDRLQKRGAK
jgi:hypothetical protein